MTRIAILGGGISGLAAAYELELARLRGADLDWHLYEAGPRLGGIIETTRIDTPGGPYILEGGPDGWVTEKPWARDLAIELGLELDLIASNDATRKTWIYLDNRLQAIPDHMRLMVPEDLAALEASPLFSVEAKRAYAAELTRSKELKASAPEHDEPVATFVRRHFGHEVLAKIAAPLLSGVFGGDVETLSVRAVMPQFVAMEREYGSLIAALQQRSRQRGDKPQPPIFTTLRNGLGSLTAALIAKLPAERLHLNNPAFSLKREGKLWCVRYNTPAARGIPGKAKKHFRHILLATPMDATASLLKPLDPETASLLPIEASSATLVCLVWPAQPVTDPRARPGVPLTIPQGFGYLVPQRPHSEPLALNPEPSLLAATFVNQKFPHRAPARAHILRAFFGSGSAEHFATTPDADVASAALHQLRSIMGPLPDPDPAFTQVRRWPRSLPQYAVGHLERMAQLDERVASLGNLTLLGNAYRGVGLPDLIRDARHAARTLAKG
jgi:oxygen-dependent protoporphyrinogen oxidase